MNLKKLDLKHNYNLRKCTTLKIGGIAEQFFVAHSPQELIAILKQTKGSFYLLGNGSNVLIQDTVRVSRPVVTLGSEFSYIDQKESTLIEVGAATHVARLLRFCIHKKLTGIENLAGIPATLGGLISMNASAFGASISDTLKEIEVMDRKGTIMYLRREEITFGYRYSSLKGMIILRAWLMFDKSDSVKDRVRAFLEARRNSQDYLYPSCGCIFKNPPGHKAGFLIDACGFKGIRKNDALVSPRHANFIVNTGQAHYSDVDGLIQDIKQKVYSTFKISLEEEVERWV